MPGEIIHTNEVMVLLGDNWFAERSAKQACEIIERRKKRKCRWPTKNKGKPKKKKKKSKRR